ncbi:flap endonuclease-1 [Candidatus Pacearchaeota archaeon]|jgi:flap endonuclease-1|nr:flap endonuclease-1 [Candidatus Pacearchaeota archaeon]
MGLNIREIIPRKEIELSDLRGKTICIDAFNTLYQFLSSIRQMDGTPLMDKKKRITSHLSGIFYRNITLLEHGIKLIYVFDGKPPELKYKTARERQENRDTARERYEEARSEEDIENMKRYSSQLVRINDEIIKESKELLEAMGIAIVQAPGEGEAQAAHLAKRSGIYASASQDYDSILFGAPKLIRNLTLAKKRKTINGWIEVKPEIIELESVLNGLEINLDQLICLGILVGTDYNPKGIPGIGQKKALQIVKKYKQPILIFNSLAEQLLNMPDEDKFNWKEIFELFHKPNVSNSLFRFGKIDEKKIRKILVEEHDFSDDRVQKQLERLREINERNKQSGLDKWF